MLECYDQSSLLVLSEQRQLNTHNSNAEREGNYKNTLQSYASLSQHDQVARKENCHRQINTEKILTSPMARWPTHCFLILFLKSETKCLTSKPSYIFFSKHIQPNTFVINDYIPIKYGIYSLA